MKTLLAVAFAAASILPAFAAETTTPRIAPEFAIDMPEGGQKLLSAYRGKVVCLALFYTTCPHCQDMARTLTTQIVPEYAPKGVQVVAAAFDDVAKTQVADFAKQYVKGGFPIGYVQRGEVNEFLQKSIMTVLYVPILVFIDRRGNIDREVLGDNDFLSNPPKNIREELNKLVAQPAPRTLSHAKSNVVHVAKR